MPDVRQTIGRGAQLLLAVVAIAAVVGYFVGQTGARSGGPAPWRPETGHLTTRAAEGDAVAAIAYADMRAQRLGPNRDWTNTLASLVQPTSDPFARVGQPDPTEDEKVAALAARAVRRAYNGAPPLVPHRVDQESSAGCIACHGPGLAVQDRRASRIPHALFASCMQCHVEQRGDAPTGAGGVDVAPLTVANGFVGLAAPLGGERAWLNAPPTVPHSTLMRADCLSCHGVVGPLGMRSSHPWRASCLQCHAPSAVLDQQPGGASATISASERP